jgi:hypothetical protein
MGPRVSVSRTLCWSATALMAAAALALIYLNLVTAIG